VERNVVWMQGWEFECCGAPFEVGSQVRWLLGVADQALRDRVTMDVGDEDGSRLTHYETHHGPDHDDELTYVTGTVATIKAVYRTYDDQGRPVEGTSYAEDRSSAVDFEDDGADGSRFSGYLIELDTP
jgi:hypothetical protein